MADTRTDALVLLAPLSGPLLAIEEVPDPAFSQKLVGDGIAIDPVTSCLLSPCAATVRQVHRAGHAVNLATSSGIELILHIGLDTVALGGEGFLPRVAAGDEVRAGQALIEFAPDYVATRARSLLTEIVVANPERVTAFRKRTGFVRAGRDTILELELETPSVPLAAAGDSPSVVASSDPVVIRNGAGLHARPAAVLAATAERFRSDVRLRRGEAEANAKSVTSIM